MKLLGLKVRSFKPLLFLALIVIAVLLRAGNLGGFHPIDQDEKSWLMVGTSLLKTGVPTGWTIFHGAYLKAGVDTRSSVTPYLDHPPLFSLLVGGWAYMVGETDMDNLNWGLVRIPMIVISIATIIVTYLFVRRAFGRVIANFTILAFVFFPTHVVASRIIAAEHLIGLLLMLGLYLFVVFDEVDDRRIRKWACFAMSIVCLLALFVKLSAVVVPASLIFLALLRRKYRLAALLIFVLVVSVLLFASYGYYYNWDAFRNVIDAHQGRGQSFTNFWALFTNLNIGNYGLYDPSIIVGSIGLLVLAMREKVLGRTGLYIFAPLLVFSFLFLYVAPVESYGWYRYSFYPMVAIGLGYVFTELWKGRNVFWILFLPLISVMLQHSSIFDDQADRKLAMMLFYAIVVLSLLWRSKLLQTRSVFMSLLLFLFFFEVVWVLQLLGVVVLI